MGIVLENTAMKHLNVLMVLHVSVKTMIVINVDGYACQSEVKKKTLRSILKEHGTITHTGQWYTVTVGIYPLSIRHYADH